MPRNKFELEQIVYVSNCGEEQKGEVISITKIVNSFVYGVLTKQKSTVSVNENYVADKPGVIKKQIIEDTIKVYEVEITKLEKELEKLNAKKN